MVFFLIGGQDNIVFDIDIVIYVVIAKLFNFEVFHLFALLNFTNLDRFESP